MDVDEIFLTARRATDRKACDRWVKEQHITNNSPDYEPAKERWRNVPWLLDPQLAAYAQSVLAESRGTLVHSHDPMPAMIWYGGAMDTHGGHQFLGTTQEFITHVLEARAQEVAAKRCGWVVTPTSSVDGRRTNASTTAMHALNLDCDARGSWTALQGALTGLGIAHILYQSGGWSPTSPKWHVLIPLARPFDTSSPEKIEAWKSAYTSARVVLGALGGLIGEGFDPTVETPSIPVFVTEKRDVNDPPRQILYRLGYALDIEALVQNLPEIVDEDDLQARGSSHRLDEEIEALADARLEEIVTALCGSMAKILSGRRDLYMAIPGALLDRQVLADDVIAIVEEVSDRCPGDPRYTRAEVSEKHREHVHCARTTIDKYERGDTYTRIGTIAERWPEVASAIDRVLPDPFAEALLSALRPKHPAAVATGSATETQASSESTTSENTRPRKKLTPLGRALSPIAKRLLEAEDVARKLRGFLLDCLVRGVAFAEGADESDIEEWTAEAMCAIGNHAPDETEWADVLAFVSDTYVAMDGGRFYTDIERTSKAKRYFEEGRKQRARYQRRRQNEKEHQRQVGLSLLSRRGH